MLQKMSWITSWQMLLALYFREITQLALTKLERGIHSCCHLFLLPSSDITAAYPDSPQGFYEAIKFQSPVAPLWSSELTRTHLLVIHCLHLQLLNELSDEL